MTEISRQQDELVEDMAEQIWLMKWPSLKFEIRTGTMNDYSWEQEYNRCFATATKLIEKLRLVQLDIDQSLPSYTGCKTVGDELARCMAEEAQQDMLKAGWVKKVKKRQIKEA